MRLRTSVSAAKGLPPPTPPSPRRKEAFQAFRLWMLMETLTEYERRVGTPCPWDVVHANGWSKLVLRDLVHAGLLAKKIYGPPEAQKSGLVPGPTWQLVLQTMYARAQSAQEEGHGDGQAAERAAGGERAES